MRKLIFILLFFVSLAGNAQGGVQFFFSKSQPPTSTFSPSDITGLKAWYVASAGVTGTTTVTAWADQSGNGYNLTAASGQEPALNSSAINGLPALNFISADRMTNSSLSQTQAYTIIVVGKLDVGNTNQVFFDSYNNVQAALYNASGTMRFLAGNTGIAGFTANTNWRLHYVVGSGAASSYDINDGSPSTGNAGTNAISGISIGQIRGNPSPVASPYGLTGYIAELLIYSTTLSSGDETLIKDYLRTKYNLY